MTGIPRIRVTPTTPQDASLWRLTREVTDTLSGLPWVLVGGQMVAILEAEHGTPVGFTTADVDALLDVRALPGVTLEASRRLLDAGFEPEREDGHGYRFVRGDAVVDVLAPDHVGGRAELRTVPPNTTIEAIGGRQALSRARRVELDTGDGPFQVPTPTLTGAIIIKARVASVAQQTREKHERDLARLLTLLPEVAVVRSEMTPKERGYLREHRTLLAVAHRAWRGIRRAQDGIDALAFLTQPD